MQTFLVIIIVILAVCYAAGRIYHALRKGGDPCRDCELRNNCQKKHLDSRHCK